MNWIIDGFLLAIGFEAFRQLKSVVSPICHAIMTSMGIPK